MSYCKFLKTETCQATLHELCQNPDMLAKNKTESGKLTCIGKKCGMAIDDTPDNAGVPDTKIP